MSIDLPQLSGFTKYYGVPLCPIGDDGEVVVALGHPEPMRAVAAFNRYARYELGMTDMLDEGPAASMASAVEQLKWYWGRLMTLGRTARTAPTFSAALDREREIEAAVDAYRAGTPAEAPDGERA